MNTVGLHNHGGITSGTSFTGTSGGHSHDVEGDSGGWSIANLNLHSISFNTGAGGDDAVTISGEIQAMPVATVTVSLEQRLRAQPIIIACLEQPHQMGLISTVFQEPLHWGVLTTTRYLGILPLPGQRLKRIPITLKCM